MPLDNPFEPMIKNIGNYVSGTLYAQGVIPPIGIDNYDGTALASPADTHLLAAKDPVINEVAVGMSGNLIGENTVMGAPPLQLPNSAGYPMQGLEVTLSPYQDLHGYDNPWPAGGGKNIAPYSVESLLFVGYNSKIWESGYASNRVTSISTGFSFSRINNNYGCGLVLGKLEEGQSYTIKATRSDQDWSCNITTFDADAVLSLETGVPRTVVHSNVNVENGYTFIALGGNIKYGITFYSAGEDKLTFEASNIQLELGSTATSFAPYENICPISGTDKLNIFVEESYDPTATPKVVIVTPDTIYVGTYDAVSGSGLITWASVDLGMLEWDFVSAAAWNCWTSSSIASLKAKGGSNIICSKYAVGVVYGTADNNIISGNANNGNIYIRDTSYSDATSFKAAMSGVQLVYELATFIPFSTDGHSINLQQGNAYTWATAEDGTVESMEVTYVGKA